MDVRVDHRQRVLRALGVVPYILRGRVGTGQVEAHTGADEEVVVVTPSREPDCVLVLPERCSVDQLRLLDRIMRTLGGAFAEASRVDVTGGELHASIPRARAYLAFGKAQAHALGRGLPADVMAQAEVLMVDTPEALSDAAAKRRLWLAVRSLRRQWRDAVGGKE